MKSTGNIGTCANGRAAVAERAVSPRQAVSAWRIAIIALAMACLLLAGSPAKAWAKADGADGLQAASVIDLVAQSIKSVTTPEGWVWRGDGESATIVGYIGQSESPTVPTTIDGKQVVGLCAKRSTGSPALTDIDLSAAAATLEKLQVRDCALRVLDLSALAHLTFADVCGNQLATLKLPGSLTELRCSGNELAALDLSGCTALEKLDCASNRIRSLDLSACPQLYYLDCSDNYLTSLECGSNLQLGDVFCHGNYIASSLPALAARYGSDSGVVLPQNAGNPPAAQGGNSDGSQSSSQGSSQGEASAPSTAKQANTLSVKAKTVKLKAAKVKKKNQAVKPAKAFAISGAQGKVTYKVAAYDKKAKKKVKVSAAGKVTVKKGLKKGAYKLKVAVTAAGDATHLPATKTVTLKVKIK